MTPLLGAIDQHLGPGPGLALAGAVPATALLLLTLTHLRRRVIIGVGLPGRPSWADTGRDGDHGLGAGAWYPASAIIARRYSARFSAPVSSG